MFFRYRFIMVMAILPLAGTTCFAQQSQSIPAPLFAEAQPATMPFSSSRAGFDALSSGSASPFDRDGGVQRPAPAATGGWFLSHEAIGTQISPLGIGAGFAASVTRSVNVRGGGSFFSYSTSGVQDGVPYNATAHLQSFQVSADWFPWHNGFHVSPGVLFQNKNRLTGAGSALANSSFTVNDRTYYTTTSGPVEATGGLAFNKTAFMFTAGWGNWIPREGRKHLSFPFDLGFAYTGDPKVALNLTGVACVDPQRRICHEISTFPEIEENIAAQRVKFANDATVIRFYPIISTGVAYKF